jgi:hypothetical protein
MVSAFARCRGGAGQPRMQWVPTHNTNSPVVCHVCHVAIRLDASAIASSAHRNDPDMTNTLLDATPDCLAERLFVRALERKPIDRLALRALMKAQRLLSLALGQRLLELRASPDRVERALAGIEASTVLIHLLRETVDLLGARIDKLPARRRPHFTPVQRFRILQLTQLAGLSCDEASKLFRVSVATLSDWRASANPNTGTVGSTVKPSPPVRRYNDTVQHLIQLMAGFGFTGYGDIARHLARAGWLVARTTVRATSRRPGSRLPLFRLQKRRSGPSWPATHITSGTSI